MELWDGSDRVPVRGQVTVAVEGRGVTLSRRRFGPARRALGRILGVAPAKTVHLDALGAAVWELIDGQRTVAEIHKELARRFPDEPELPLRLGKYLGALASARMIRL